MRRLKRTRSIRRCRNSLRYVDHASLERGIAFGTDIPPELRGVALTSLKLRCQMCGVMPDGTDDLTGRRVEFRVIKIEAARPGEAELSDLRVVCSTCYCGAKELYIERAAADGLLGSQAADQPRLSALLREIGSAK